MKKRSLILLAGALSASLCSCGDNKKEEIPEPIDYGKVSFQDITVYKNYDGVRIVPIFTNPEACKNEEFTYEVENENVISIDEGFVYRVDNGNNIKVTAKQRTIDRTGANPGTNLFLGDSFFEFWKNKTGISENFATAFNGYDVTNIGISATQSKHWRSWVGGVVNDYEAKNIVVNIGINDVDDANLTGIQAGKNVVSLLEQIHADNPDAKIYWFTLTRCSGYFANKWNEYQVCNNFVMEYSKLKDYITVLDIASLYGDNYASYQQDGLHPNQEGYNLFKQLILDNINL